jgi:hypothetical protein
LHSDGLPKVTFPPQMVCLGLWPFWNLQPMRLDFIAVFNPITSGIGRESSI